MNLGAEGIVVMSVSLRQVSDLLNMPLMILGTVGYFCSQWWTKSQWDKKKKAMLLRVRMDTHFSHVLGQSIPCLGLNRSLTWKGNYSSLLSASKASATQKVGKGSPVLTVSFFDHHPTLSGPSLLSEPMLRQTMPIPHFYHHSQWLSSIHWQAFILLQLCARCCSRIWKLKIPNSYIKHCRRWPFNWWGKHMWKNHNF